VQVELRICYAVGGVLDGIVFPVQEVDGLAAPFPAIDGLEGKPLTAEWAALRIGFHTYLTSLAAM
jgi:hypothetical protein